jgi:nucleoside-diphosphate-sugar epimerase
MSRQFLLAGVGDLNRRVARRLLEQGHQVIGLRRSQPDTALGFEQRSVDLAVEPWPDVGADTIIIALSAAQRDAEGYRRGYVLPVQQLGRSIQDWQKPPQRIIVVGSSRVYGANDGRELTEASPIQPSDWGGDCLAEMEAAVDRLPGQTAVARLSGIYGPGRDWLRRKAMSAGSKPPETNHWTNRIHIEDAAAALVHLTSQPDIDSRYLITDRRPAPLFEVLNYLRQIQGLSPLQEVPEVAGGKRLLSDRLAATGFEWQYPDYRAGGYHTLDD